jgi:hypothetical protein
MSSPGPLTGRRRMDEVGFCSPPPAKRWGGVWGWGVSPRQISIEFAEAPPTPDPSPPRAARVGGGEIIIDTPQRSRGAISPELCMKCGPRKTEGAGKTGCALHPRSRVQIGNKENAHEHTGSAETLRPSPRSGFTAYFELSPVTGLSCHRHRRFVTRRLDTSVGVSGPHDFAVRS